MDRRRIITPAQAVRDDAQDVYARARHARYLECGPVYHIISRTRGNLFLLRPDLHGLLRRIFIGVLAEAKRNWPHILNFATVVLSNHLHALLAALEKDPRDIAPYVGFIKREIARRWSMFVNWEGSMWEGYLCSAVITDEAQLTAFNYVLSQSVKENLVEDPRDWPGFHCAQSLMTGEPAKGFWFDGTRYGKAVHAQRAKKEENRQVVSREDYEEERTFSFDRLPALNHLGPDEYRNVVCRTVADIVETARERRRQSNARVLGVEGICAQDTRDGCPVPVPVWFENRKRMIVWDDTRNPEVKAYLDRYWEHQRKFRAAADRWKEDNKPLSMGFPKVCFIPGRRSRPIPHVEQGGG